MYSEAFEYLVPATCSDNCCAEGSQNKGLGRMNPCLHSQERFKKESPPSSIIFLSCYFNFFPCADSNIKPTREWMNINETGQRWNMQQFSPKLIMKMPTGRRYCSTKHTHSHTHCLWETSTCTGKCFLSEKVSICPLKFMVHPLF